MGSVITLTTDFGLRDGYVAAMKGVILGINPGATVVDISHDIPAQDIARAAFIFSTVYRYFPRGTIHVVVVDPGVGTKRRAIIAKSPDYTFVAPDNGVLGHVVRPYLAEGPRGGRCRLGRGTGLDVFAITEERFFRRPVSATFHGRDIFAPVAAHLSLGVPAAEFGRPVGSLAVLEIAAPLRKADGTISGHIVYVDRFGNLITDIAEDHLPAEKTEITVKIRGRRIRGLSRTYAQQKKLLALIGSSGYLEIALRNGSAADYLGVGAGEVVEILTGTGNF
ncbi:MAG: SAM-dependent chlorinase/fluorinase [Dehalococcoidales bacterium]|nr:SAM-dependent chlorinase/fluorinase [Dehalococcoidales bacterium]